MTLPLLISVPHAGLEVPSEVADDCLLTPEEIMADGDEGAAEIYDFPAEVAAYVTSNVARAIVDLNRAEDDFRKDGVIKTHTCWDVPVWRRRPSAKAIESLLDKYHRPYHRRLSEPAAGVRLGVDCHTMAAFGPPIGPDAGAQRPPVCLSDGEGTCPRAWVEALARWLERSLGVGVPINHPFRGGYIVRRHAAQRPWVQLELSRAPFLDTALKRRGVLEALAGWCAEI
ncbi:MAG: N-formylglutamate amidohydrolase [Proteobacteria bacterium]|nr:N-formylglutamate amidohydrolase [Pseudomonadota bacterium]MBU1742908.1 N-formylglutamate amidohydrolase [Pseudomonadota bacterium]